MLVPKTMNKFESDFVKAKKQHKNIDLLKKIMELLANEIPLESKYLDHPLKGKWKGTRECHVENDWLLIYRIREKENEIWFERLGSHSQLFK
jgi:mRNA interferase YafQ